MLSMFIPFPVYVSGVHDIYHTYYYIICHSIPSCHLDKQGRVRDISNIHAKPSRYLFYQLVHVTYSKIPSSLFTFAIPFPVIIWISRVIHHFRIFFMTRHTYFFVWFSIRFSYRQLKHPFLIGSRNLFQNCSLSVIFHSIPSYHMDKHQAFH